MDGSETRLLFRVYRLITNKMLQLRDARQHNTRYFSFSLSLSLSLLLFFVLSRRERFRRPRRGDEGRVFGDAVGRNPGNLSSRADRMCILHHVDGRQSSNRGSHSVHVWPSGRQPSSRKSRVSPHAFACAEIRDRFLN